MLPPQITSLRWFNPTQIPMAVVPLCSSPLRPGPHTALPHCCCHSSSLFFPPEWYLGLTITVFQHQITKAATQRMGKGTAGGGSRMGSIRLTRDLLPEETQVKMANFFVYRSNSFPAETTHSPPCCDGSGIEKTAQKSSTTLSLARKQEYKIR